MKHSLPPIEVEEIISPKEEREFEYVEVPLTHRVFVSLVLIGCAVAVIFLARIGYFAFAEGGYYSSRALANMYEESVLPAPRGIIYDRFGEPLVENRSAWSVRLNVSRLLGEGGEKERAYEALSEILDISRERAAAAVASVNLERNNFVKVADDITAKQAIDLKDLELPALQVAGDYARFYPEAETFSHIAGYASAGGLTGLEAAYDSALRGVDGVTLKLRDARGGEYGEKRVREPVAGGSITTTIDADLQRYFMRRLRQGLETLGRTKGAGIALNPQTGEVLAMVSLPSYDNNRVADYLSVRGEPLWNRAIAGLYPPGSVIKPLVALAALREKVVTPSFVIFSSGVLEVPNPYVPEEPSRFLDWRPHGWVDLAEALARSSNIYFYGVSGGLPRETYTYGPTPQPLGIERLRRYWEQFHFGSALGIDLPGEADGFLPSPEEKERRTGEFWRLGDTYNVAIGQGDLLVTPLQIIDFIASVGNGGRLMRPYLVRGPGAPQTLVDYSSWGEELAAVERGLRDAVKEDYGTAHLLSSLPVSAAGKTGSAQVANNTRVNAFFAGYLPAEDPAIAVLVLIENAREGSLNAVPIARDVLEWYYYNRLRPS